MVRFVTPTLGRENLQKKSITGSQFNKNFMMIKSLISNDQFVHLCVK